jgi:hypothetical protein
MLQAQTPPRQIELKALTSSIHHTLNFPTAQHSTEQRETLLRFDIVE